MKKRKPTTDLEREYNRGRSETIETLLYFNMIDTEQIATLIEKEIYELNQS